MVKEESFKDILNQFKFKGECILEEVMILVILMILLWLLIMIMG
ncbi:MAG: hypothetical protein ACRDCW_11230 [Sarcina sp.]